MVPYSPFSCAQKQSPAPKLAPPPQYFSSGNLQEAVTGSGPQGGTGLEMQIGIPSENWCPLQANEKHLKRCQNGPLFYNPHAISQG